MRATRVRKLTFSTTGAGAALGASFLDAFLESLESFLETLGAVSLETFLLSDLAIIDEVIGDRKWMERRNNFPQQNSDCRYIYRSTPVCPANQNFVKKVSKLGFLIPRLVISLRKIHLLRPPSRLPPFVGKGTAGQAE